MLLVAVVATGDYHILKCDVSDDLFLVATMVATGSKNTTTNSVFFLLLRFFGSYR